MQLESNFRLDTFCKGLTMKLKMTAIKLITDFGGDEVVPHFQFALAIDEDIGMDGTFNIAIPMDREKFMRSSITDLAAFAENELRRELVRGQ